MERCWDRLHRRRFVLGAGLAGMGLLAGCGPLPWQTQPPAKIPRIGYLAAVSASADAPRLEAFRQGLRGLGYIEGQNIFIEYRHENRDLNRLPEIAAELVRLEPDVLVAVTTNAAQAAKNATMTIPVIFMGVTDPIAAGLVDTLAHLGGNSTGVTNMAAILTGKRLQLLKDTIPEIARIAVLWDPQAPGSAPQWEESQLPARELGLQLYSMEVSNAEKYESAFQDAIEARSDAIWVTLNPLANSNQKVIAELAINNRLPSLCAREDYSDNGCLMAYGPGYANEGRDGARYVDRILKGARPADLPVEQPMTFEFVVNINTARALGIMFPNDIMLQVTRVVQ